MGTVLSLSPLSSKVSIVDDGGDGKTLKKQSVIISTLTFKRFLSAPVKKTSAKKVSPCSSPAPGNPGYADAHLNNENFKTSQKSKDEKTNGPLALPTPTVSTTVKTDQKSPKAKQLVSVQKQPSSLSIISSRRVVLQASTGELLRCLGEFMCKRCFKLKDLRANEVILWFRNVDRTLLLQGWQDQGFITPANLVFVYLLCRETVTDDVSSQRELQGTFLTCLYLAYSYIGNEISYPLKPFMVETNIDVFWERSLDVIDKLSGKMLQINIDPHFFTEVFQDLKNEGDYKPDGGELDR